MSPQCVTSGCPTSGFAGKSYKYCFCSSTYVSAFGFVGFILFFPNFYLFLDQCWKTVCPPRPFIKCLKVLQFSTNWPGSSHWVTARRTKKNLYNLPRCFAKITDFKKRKKKFIKYPPKWALYTRTWLALYRPLSKGGQKTNYLHSAYRTSRAQIATLVCSVLFRLCRAFPTSQPGFGSNITWFRGRNSSLVGLSRIACFHIRWNALNCQGRIWSCRIFIHPISSGCDLRDGEPVQEKVAVCHLVKWCGHWPANCPNLLVLCKWIDVSMWGNPSCAFQNDVFFSACIRSCSMSVRVCRIFIWYLIHDQRKFRSSNFRLYWKLPVGLAASMLDSRDVRHERFWRVGIARNAVFFHGFVASKVRKGMVRKARWCEGSAAQDVDKICATPARESDSEVKIVKNWRCRSTFRSGARQNLHHACPRERFGSQKSLKTGMPGPLLEVELRKNCTTPARESDLEAKIVKTPWVRSTFWRLSFAKIAPRLRARAIRKSKSLKHRGFRALLEVELRKLCTTPARESDLKDKIVKNWRSRGVFGGSKCFSRGRRRDFDTLQNTWQAQEFVRVAKTLAGVVDLKRLRNDAFRVAGAVIWRFVMPMFEASDAESVEGLQISCHGSVTLQWSFRVAVSGLRMPRLNFFAASAILLKRSLQNR